MVADMVSCYPDIAAACKVLSNLLGLVRAIQARAEGMDEWNRTKLDAANGWHNMMIYEGLVCRSCGADSHVTVTPDNKELKHCLIYDHHNSPTLGRLGLYNLIGSLSS